MGKKVLIKLKSLFVDENGLFEDGKKASNFLETLLVSPKVEVSSIRSVLQIQLKDKLEFLEQKRMEIRKELENVDPSNKKYIEDLLLADLDSARTLFKIEIESEAILQINLSSIEKISKVEKIILSILGKAATTAIGTISGIGSVLKAVISSTSESIFSTLLNDEDKINSIGKGFLIINENDPNLEGIKKIDLFVPKEIRIRPIDKWNNDGTLKEGVHKPLVLSKWKPNGYIEIEIRCF